VHDFESDGECGYLASSATGDRVYLAREVLDADVVISVGQIAFDSVLGYRGTNSVFYPGLSNVEAAERSQGQGHRELGPDDERPLRSLIDEIGWLLGTQFTVQTLPGENGGVSRVMAGSTDAVLRQGKRLLNEDWRVRLNTRSDLVVATIDGLAPGDGWQKLGAAVEAARNLVARDGRIVILSDFSAEPGEGMQLVRDSLEPADALQPLRSIAPPDMLPASQIAGAAGWASLFLLSGLNAATVEELFMTPLANHREVQRLLEGDRSCVLLESAHFLATDVAG
jgi:nickel-dependent lactate racemase